MRGYAGAGRRGDAEHHRNGLADPGLIGVKEGASIGGPGAGAVFPGGRPGLAAAGGNGRRRGGGLLVLTLARDCSRPRFILIGVGVSWTLAAAVGIFMTTADVRDVQTAMIWLAGSLRGRHLAAAGVAFCWAAARGLSILFCTARAADAALLGDRTAFGLGVRLQQLTLLRFFAPVLLTSASVSCVGSLGFVGLMAPHMARFVLRGGQVSLLSGSALIGALLVLVTDTLGRLAFAPLQIPAGIVIALVGCPFLLSCSGVAAMPFNQEGIMRWFVSLLLLLTGAVSAADPQTQTFTDDLGRTVTVPLHPQRIVSMHDLDITIPLIELGAPPIASHGRTRPDGSHYLRSSAQLTGVDFDNSDIRFIGTADIDLEAVAAARPDLIITEPSRHVSVEQLEKIAPTVSIDHLQGSAPEIYRKLAQLTGTQPRWRSSSAAIRSKSSS